MNDNQQRSNGDILDRSAAALRDASIPAGPPPALAAATVNALIALASADSAKRPARSHGLPRLVRRAAVAAAMFAAFVVGVSWLLDRNASTTFAQVLEHVKKAKSVRFVLHQKIGDQAELETKVFMQDNTIRHEIANIAVFIVDTDLRKGIQLDVSRKVASRIDLEGRIPKEQLADPIARLRNLEENSKDSIEQLPDEVLDGGKCHVYQVKDAKETAVLVPSKFKLWVDAKTRLPVKIHAQDEMNSLLYKQFIWNEPADAKLFSLEIPKGYRLENLVPAVITPGRIYYHEEWVELHSIQSDGMKPETQFVPRLRDTPSMYVSNRAAMSPDGRYLAIAYTHVTDKGAFPPCRVLLWDRTRPKEKAAEIYVRPEGELQAWQFSTDGKRLFVSYWEGMPDRKGPDGRTGTDVVDLKTNEIHPVQLPTYKTAEGKDEAMRFAAASADGRTYLVVGQGLHVATAKGELVRRLTAPEVRVLAPTVRLSPDGKHALFATHRPDGSHQLFVVPIAGGAPKELVGTRKLTDLRAQWSPDGKRIAYTGRLFDSAQSPRPRGSETYLKLVDPDGANPVALLTRKVPPSGPSLELTSWR